MKKYNNWEERFNNLVDEFRHLIVNILKEQEAKHRKEIKAFKNIMKDYWYYAGRWHKAECSFIQSDRGVCDCKSINKEINNKLKDFNNK